MILLALSFDTPAALGLFALVPFVLAAWIRADARRARQLREALGARAEQHAGRAAPRALRRRRIATGLALACLVLALAGPRHGAGAAPDAAPALDILLCLDVSRSMRARDLERDRLDFAHRSLAALATHTRGERLGLLAFAGEAALLVPLTADADSFAFLATRCDELSIERGGSDVARALLHARGALRRRSEAKRRPAVLALLSDGDRIGRDALAAAEQCAADGVRIDTIGLASPLGSKIPTMPDAETAGASTESFVKDRSGRDVLSKLDVEGLRALARTGGGSFVPATQSESPLVELYDSAWRGLARSAASGERSAEKARHGVLLVLALLAMLAAAVPVLRLPNVAHGTKP